MGLGGSTLARGRGDRVTGDRDREGGSNPGREGREERNSRDREYKEGEKKREE